MTKPVVTETFVYQWKPEKGETWYLAIKHKQTLTGWTWTYGLARSTSYLPTVDQIQS